MLNETGVPMQGLSITPNAFVYDINDNLVVDANKDNVDTYINVSTPGNYLFLSNASCTKPSVINFASMDVEQTKSGTIHHVVSSEQFIILRLISGSVKVSLKIHNSDNNAENHFKTFLFGMRIDDYIEGGHGPL